ncbi:MAG: hypothetical protein OEY29_01690 [Gammaproteobacteria bacterium]|nr:hypothetical protein [Gammaproteobacteria bacterium]
MLDIKNLLVIILLGLIGFVATPVSLAAETTQNKIKKPEAGQYTQQLAYYLQKEQENHSDPLVTYNLGVIFYKLKQYPQAKVRFQKLLSVDAYHLVAKYNLGLVAYKSGDTKKAIQWFREISAHTHPFKSSDSIIKLAKVQLDKLSQSDIVINKKKTVRALNNYLFAYYGYDDHLIDPIGNVITGDDFLNIYALHTFTFDNAALEGISWKFDVYSKDYSDLNGYDYNVIGTDFGKQLVRKNWRHSLRVRLDKSTYGATDYQSATRLELKTQYVLSAHKASVHYRYYDITSDNVLYDAYEGNRQQLGFIYTRVIKPHRLKLTLEFEDNDRADDKTLGVVNQSYSASRSKMKFDWSYQFNASWKSSLSYEHNSTRYNDMNSAGIVRDETLAGSQARLKYRLQKNWWLVSDLAYTDNVSNIAQYSYTRSVMRVGINGSF